MTNREKFNQCLLNYVKSIINMEDEDLIKIALHSYSERWYGHYLRDFLHIYGYHEGVARANDDDLEFWLTQECIENAEM